MRGIISSILVLLILVPVAQITSQSIEILSTSPISTADSKLERDTQVKKISLDYKMLLSSTDIIIDDVTLLLLDTEFRSKKNFTIYFKIKGTEGNGVLTVVNGKIMSQFVVGNLEYSLRSRNSRSCELIKKILEESSQFECESYTGSSTFSPKQVLKSSSNDLCRIRVLMLWTTQSSTIYDIALSSQNAIDNINLVSSNSGLPTKFELAKVHIYDGISACGITSCNLFVNNAPWFPECDEIPDLREQYEADIAVTVSMTSSSSSSGNACDLPDGSGIVDVNRSICHLRMPITTPATSISGSGGRYLLEHEVGHLLGGRHDPAFESSSSTPLFARGWLFTYQGLLRGTVMSRQGLRIPHYSNPNETWNGVATGSSNANNVAQINVVDQNVANNRIVSSHHIIDGETVSDQEIGHHVALNKIETKDIGSNPANAILLENGSVMTMRTSESIRLKPGFRAMAGSIFHGYIADPCTTSPSYEFSDDDEPIALKRNVDLESVLVDEFKVYPNPSSYYLVVSIPEYRIKGAHIYIHDMSGALVLSKYTLNQSENILDVSSLNEGLYTVKVVYNDNSFDSQQVILID